MTKAREFAELRSLLFAIAYRILGSVSEAEDAVQETWLRFDGTTTPPASTKAFLSAIVTRISIDVLRSARVRREQYVGHWFPEPLVSDPYADPARSAELADSVSMAALLLLEQLSPLERAVFVLRDVFAFEFSEISEVVERSPDACRQLAVRARAHMDAGRPRFEADGRHRDELAARFFDAIRDGDLESLQLLLAADVTMIGDSGGKAPLWSKGLFGRANVARLLSRTMPWFFHIGGSFERAVVNGQPGAIFRDRNGFVLNTWSLDVRDGQVQAIRTVLNPDKLGHLGKVANAYQAVQDVYEARRDAARD